MPDALDFKTIYYFTSLASVLFCVCFAYIRHTRKTYPGFTHWMAGWGADGIGLMFFGMYTILPVPVSITLGSLFVIAAQVLALRGLRAFCNTPQWNLFDISACLLAAACALLFTLAYPSIPAQFIVNYLLLGLCFMFSARWAGFETKNVLERPNKLLFYSFAVLVPFACAQFFFASAFPEHMTNPLNPSAFRKISALFFLCGRITVALGMILLNTQRLEQELKQAGKDLVDSEERFRGLFQDSADAQFLIFEDRFVDCNQAAVKYLAMGSIDDVLNLRPWDISPPTQPNGENSAPEALAHLNTALKRGSHRFEWIHSDFTGREFPVEILLTRVEFKGQSFLHSTWHDISYRKHAQEALYEREKRYRSLFEAAGDAIILLSIERGFFMVNPAALEMFGYDSEDEFLSLTPESVSPETQPDGSYSRTAARRMMSIAEDRGQYEFEWLHKRKDGELFTASVRLTIMEFDGEMIIQATLRDITKAKRAQLATEESEQKYRSLFELESDALFLVNSGNMRIMDANYAASSMYGYSRSELPGTDIRDLSSPADNDVPHPPPGSPKPGPEENGRQYHVRKNGDVFPVEVTSNHFQWKGETVHMSAVRDITDRVQAEEALKKTSGQLENIFNSAQVGLMLLMGGRIFARGNQRLADILGYASPDEMKGFSMRALHLTEDRFMQFGEQYFYPLSRGELLQVEYELRRKDGSPIWCSLSGKALDDTDPPDVDKGVLWVVDDISKRKKAEAKLEAALELAEAATKAKSEFLASMSHEIRTPLNAILGMSEMLGKTKLTADQSICVENLDAAGDILSALINDVLDFSKIEAGRLSLEKTGFRPAEVVEKIRSIMEGRARDKNLALRTDVAPGVPEYVIGDPTRLEQVLINLVGNGVKFTASGEVALSLSRAPEDEYGQDMLLFTVTDTGIGIPEDKWSVIFDSFAQADSSTTREYGGSGLGLAICKRLVDLMGGIITLESTADRGATFSFTAHLPECDKEKDTTARPLRPCPVPEDLPPMRVLLAEDIPFNRTVVRMFLNGAPITLKEAANGKEAVDMVEREHFDVVLMDLEMPVMDGLEAVRHIRRMERKKGVPPCTIFAVTAHALEDKKKQSYEMGCDGVLTKPLKQSVLLEALAGTVPQEPCPGQGKADESPQETDAYPPEATELTKQAEGVNSIIEQLIPAFLADAHEATAQMRAALESGDDGSYRRLAHGYKGAAASYNLQGLATLFLAVEKAQGAGEADDALLAVEAALNGLESAYNT